MEEKKQDAEKAPLPTRKDEFDAYRHPDDASFDKFVRALDRAYHRPWIMIWRAFLQGIATAIGATVGAGLVFVVLFYALRTLDFAPYVKTIQDIIIPEKIREQLDSSVEVITSPALPASPTPTE